MIIQYKTYAMEGGRIIILTSKHYARSLRFGVYMIGLILSFPLAAQLLDAGDMVLADSSTSLTEKYETVISNVVKQRDGAYYTYIGSILLDKAHASYSIYLLILAVIMLYSCIAITLKHLLLDPIKFTSNFVALFLRLLQNRIV